MFNSKIGEDSQFHSYFSDGLVKNHQLVILRVPLEFACYCFCWTPLLIVSLGTGMSSPGC